jgi:DNA-binding response OmpR family regulator
VLLRGCALVRRRSHAAVLQVADLQAGHAAHTVRRGGRIVSLTRTEYNRSSA